jgi:nuclear GTP-binding protein
MPKKTLHGKAKNRKIFNAKTHLARVRTTNSINCKSAASNNPYRKAPGEGDFYRSRAKIKLLNLYDQKADKEKMRERPKEPACIEPDRKWFGNTRVIGQKELEKLRNEYEEQQTKKDPYTIVINQRKLPMPLISDTIESTCPKILAVEPFSV